ncbi:hypothetical protein BC832DRAFT_341453 [Gaertneriomyces semiglobifer]|nr:hypothetical protein BC832DRAFT_341453 [Gaertneriomyces semiglobifer]
MSERGRSRDRPRDRSPLRNGSRGYSPQSHGDYRRRSEREEVRSLFVRGIADGTGSDELIQAFETYGTVADCYLPRDYYTGKPRGFAYVQYSTQEEADRAFQKIEYIHIHGRKLSVEWAAGRRKTPDQMRVKVSGSRDRRRSPNRHYRPGGRSRSRSPRRRRYSRSRSRSPRRRYRRSRSPSYDRRRRSPSPRRSPGSPRRLNGFDSANVDSSPVDRQRPLSPDRASPVKMEVAASPRKDIVDTQELSWSA